MNASWSNVRTMTLKALPNLLTLARIAVVPVIVAVLMVRGDSASWCALALFAAAGVTDYLDGWLARRLDAQSRFGALLDPIADKLIVAAVLVMLIARGTVSGIDVVCIVAILLRELAISGLREFLAADRITVPVSMLAKWKTAVQMIAIALLLIPAGPGTLLQSSALAALWIAAALSLWTGATYVAQTYPHWRIRAEDGTP